MRSHTNFTHRCAAQRLSRSCTSARNSSHKNSQIRLSYLYMHVYVSRCGDKMTTTTINMFGPWMKSKMMPFVLIFYIIVYTDISPRLSIRFGFVDYVVYESNDVRIFMISFAQHTNWTRCQITKIKVYNGMDGRGLIFRYSLHCNQSWKPEVTKTNWRDIYGNCRDSFHYYFFL